MMARAFVRATRMNKTEAARAERLTLWLHAGTILRFDFQPEKLRLADNTFYTPDFRVVHADGSITMEDVKGAKGSRYWCEEDAKIKIKLAAELHPYRFVIVWTIGGGVWLSEDF